MSLSIQPDVIESERRIMNKFDPEKQIVTLHKITEEKYTIDTLQKEDVTCKNMFLRLIGRGNLTNVVLRPTDFSTGVNGALSSLYNVIYTQPQDAATIWQNLDQYKKPE